MRLKNFTSLFCRINECFIKSKCFTSHSSFSVSISRSFSEWDIVGAVCLERKPVLTQALTPLEEKYFRFLQKIEVERSFLSDHEKRKIQELRIEEKLKAGTLEDMDMIAKQTSQDFEDACIAEFRKYNFATRLSLADVNNDRHSTERKLGSCIVLAINEKLGNEFKWVLPQAIHKEGETLRQTAERALKQVATCHGSVQFMGNSPVGYYKYKYPKAARGNGVCGAKVFFFKALLLDTNEGSVIVNKSETINDYLWLTHNELKEVFVPVLHKTVMSFLFPDIFVFSTIDFDQEFDSKTFLMNDNSDSVHQVQ